ncbi:tyrosine recombinase XerS [Pseudolactococcus insecticola]|uniref:Tyrosine recombinase XerS n=1 Tax=Pseudolactococcus insecticola TaxID=2709158 RepID=A0A6A0BAC4_9LACT|nr:tyrosine recombinase XerS [Lactococcus insecticola]GFH41411.1 tyrosine recombinase XerS [Lactococcus insecticola]
MTKIQDKIDNQLKQLPDYIQDYYQHNLVQGFSKQTFYTYFKNYLSFFAWLISEEISSEKYTQYISLECLEKLTKNDAERYISYLNLRNKKVGKTNQTLNQSTIYNIYNSIRSLYHFLTTQSPYYVSEENKIINDKSNARERTINDPYFYRNVWLKVQVKATSETLQSRANHLKSKLFVNDTDEFLNYLANDYELSLSIRAKKWFLKVKNRDLALFALISASGLRISEAINLSMKDINITQMTADVIRKGNKRDTVVIASFARGYLEEYLNDRIKEGANSDSNGFIFTANTNTNPANKSSNQLLVDTAERNLTKYSTAYGKPTTPHKLRHTLATRLYKTTSNLNLVGTQLGHTSTKTTQLYTHIDDREIIDSLDKL